MHVRRELTMELALRVTVAIISVAGMMPLLTLTTMRGKDVDGKTAEDIRSAESTPAAHSSVAMMVIASACRVAKYPSRDDPLVTEAPQTETDWMRLTPAKR